MALKDIKTKIKATDRTHKVTRAMEAVSAVKMRKTQATALAGRPYARAALSILARLSGSPALKHHPLMHSNTKVKPLGNEGNQMSLKTALVVITSDKGLAGALNSGVIKEAERALLHPNSASPSKDALDERGKASMGKQGYEGRPRENVLIFAYGRKGEEFFRRRGYTIVKAFENKQDEVSLPYMAALAKELSEGFAKGEFDEVVVVYSNFKSTFEQVPTIRRLLPLSLPSITDIVNDIVPEKGRFSETRKFESPSAYEVEPGAAEVLSVLVPRLVAISLYHMLLEAKASEHSARMVAMKNASDKSEEVSYNLTRTYNKIRQAAITREISEIVGGREALAK